MVECVVFVAVVVLLVSFLVPVPVYGE